MRKPDYGPIPIGRITSSCFIVCRFSRSLTAIGQ
jgi:hypothetical protein